MSGRVLRSVCTAALAAVTALAAVPAPPATAEPTAEPSAEPSGRPGQPGQSTVSTMLTNLQTLYRQAEEAGETYNATEEQLRTQQARTARLARDLARARNAVVMSRGDAGRLAREQYQGSSELSTYLQLLLARNPQQALDQDHLIERRATGRLATMARLDVGAKRADTLAAESRKALAKEQVLAARQKRARDRATSRLKAVEALLASLTTEEIAGLAAQEQSDTAEAQEKLLATGVLDGKRTPSEEGVRALEYAVEQVGKPYLWGAEGPESYDCSGLTSQAWASAGRSIPRTSQEQWEELPKVSLDRLRPGDLVIYFPEATHVAIYLGDGMVVQAPRPGTRVKVSPIAANPLLGAVRPDPAGSPLSTYTPPRLPDGATAGPDTGYSGTEDPDAPDAEDTSVR
ncbi:C40 family peptidase [Streptomyces lunaelactis]|uniref:C40 family peptidase n=1 Tax=Streptomyces lunaelactis TaxID=1535768 RepID=UPI001584FB70|nr:C40 family peptidase [Streptomyces lunaelactis]NUK03787.1 C40 family peptidase [Streptomyces lunaelactis]NUK20285.1 C40 family peptidase [Streptomyces lunaelactis]